MTARSKISLKAQPSKQQFNRLPHWLKQHLPDKEAISFSGLLTESCVNTVCVSAKCPNSGFCFKNSQLTFMILGNLCTRNCLFCGIPKSQKSVSFVDSQEPFKIAELVKRLKLKYAVITSVTRDDLKDGGASHFAKTIDRLREEASPSINVEVLIPDFSGVKESLDEVIGACPDVLGHNIETVKSLFRRCKPDSDYMTSLKILKHVKRSNSRILTKSSIMLGMGETENEVVQSMSQLIDNGCDILALGQYIAPSPRHYPVKEFLPPQIFLAYKEKALKLGFSAVISGPLVRSSYRAGEIFNSLRKMIKTI